jgi:hypothetical protein
MNEGSYKIARAQKVVKICYYLITFTMNAMRQAILRSSHCTYRNSTMIHVSYPNCELPHSCEVKKCFTIPTT